MNDGGEPKRTMVNAGVPSSSLREVVGKVCGRITPRELADLTYSLVRIPSPTLHEEEISRHYYSVLDEFGLDVRLQPVDGGRSNVIGVLAGVGGGNNLLLGGHLDTISPENCVEPRIEGNKVYGRGAEDMKGSLAAMALAAKALTICDVKLKGDLLLAGWVGHEAPLGMGEGPRLLAKEIRDGRLKVDGAVITEGKIDSITVAQGGMAIFKVKAEGRRGGVHTSLLQLSSNPILWMSLIIKELHKMDKELGGKPWHRLIPERPSIQLGTVQGGDFYNRMPENVEITGTIRWDPDEDFETVKKNLQERLKRTEQRIKHELDPSAKIGLNMRMIRDSYELDEAEDLPQKLRDASILVTGEDLNVTGIRVVTDLSILGGEGGVPTVAYGPSIRGETTAHSDNEWIDSERLARVARTLAALAILYCGVEN